jgi:hypothetical protein
MTAVQCGSKQTPGFFSEPAEDARPWAERFPAHAFPADHEPWSGNEVGKFEMIGRFEKRMAGHISNWLRSNPQPLETIEKGRQFLAHLSARRNALLQSWAPLGSAN